MSSVKSATVSDALDVGYRPLPSSSSFEIERTVVDGSVYSTKSRRPSSNKKSTFLSTAERVAILVPALILGGVVGGLCGSHLAGSDLIGSDQIAFMANSVAMGVALGGMVGSLIIGVVDGHPPILALSFFTGMFLAEIVGCQINSAEGSIVPWSMTAGGLVMWIVDAYLNRKAIARHDRQVQQRLEYPEVAEDLASHIGKKCDETGISPSPQQPSLYGSEALIE